MPSWRSGADTPINTMRGAAARQFGCRTAGGSVCRDATTKAEEEQGDALPASPCVVQRKVVLRRGSYGRVGIGSSKRNSGNNLRRLSSLDSSRALAGATT